MVALNIRNLPEELHTKLRIRAAKGGVSMEAEARRILAAALQEEEAEVQDLEALQNLVEQLYCGRKPAAVVDTLLAERRQEGR